MDRRYTDFYNTTVELFHQQHVTLESYERQFASLRQCCSGTASDLSGFEARALPILRRLEHRQQSTTTTTAPVASNFRLAPEEERDNSVHSYTAATTTTARTTTTTTATQRDQIFFDRIVSLLKEQEKMLLKQG